MLFLYINASTPENYPLLNPKTPHPTYVMTSDHSQEIQLEKAFTDYKKMHDIYEKSFSSNVWCFLFGGSLSLFSLSIFMSDFLFPQSFYAQTVRAHFIECTMIAVFIPLCAMGLVWEILEYRSDKAKARLKKAIDCFLLNSNHDSKKLSEIQNRILGESFLSIYDYELPEEMTS